MKWVTAHPGALTHMVILIICKDERETHYSTAVILGGDSCAPREEKLIPSEQATTHATCDW